MIGAGDLASVLVPVYACVAGGVLWAKIERPVDLGFVATFVYVVGAPALVFAAVMRVEPGSVPFRLLAEAALAALAVAGVLAVGVSLAAGRALGGSARGLALPFAGALGLSMLRDALGPAALAEGAVYFAVVTLAVATVGRAAARGSWNLGSLFGSPIAWGMAAALALIAVPWTPPKVLVGTAWLLGGLVMPTLLVAAGIALGRTAARDVVRHLPVGLARFAVGLAAGYAVAEGLSLDGITRAVVLIETAMPVSFLWTVYATRDGKGEAAWPAFAASLAVMLAALPLMAFLVL